MGSRRVSVRHLVDVSRQVTETEPKTREPLAPLLCNAPLLSQTWQRQEQLDDDGIEDIDEEGANHGHHQKR